VIQSLRATVDPTPAIQRESLRGEEAMTGHMSAGSPMRYRACIRRMKLRPISVRAKFDMSGSITPGATDEQIVAEPNRVNERELPPFLIVAAAH